MSLHHFVDQGHTKSSLQTDKGCNWRAGEQAMVPWSRLWKCKGSMVWSSVLIPITKWKTVIRWLDKWNIFEKYLSAYGGGGLSIKIEVNVYELWSKKTVFCQRSFAVRDDRVKEVSDVLFEPFFKQAKHTAYWFNKRLSKTRSVKMWRENKGQ